MGDGRQATGWPLTRLAKYGDLFASVAIPLCPGYAAFELGSEIQHLGLGRQLQLHPCYFYSVQLQNAYLRVHVSK